MKTTKYELTPTNGRKSFYGKASVEVKGDTKTLKSYDTPVCRIKGGDVTLMEKWDYSVTTITHVRAFLESNGFEAGGKAQIAKRYA